MFFIGVLAKVVQHCYWAPAAAIKDAKVITRKICLLEHKPAACHGS
jgi:hypothetical protein